LTTSAEIFEAEEQAHGDVKERGLKFASFILMDSRLEITIPEYRDRTHSSFFRREVVTVSFT
jgi:hypothetical protein